MFILINEMQENKFMLVTTLLLALFCVKSFGQQGSNSCSIDQSSCLCYGGTINCSEINLRQLMSNVRQISSHISRIVPRWYRYRYGFSTYRIYDGGRDMFDNGNIIYFGSGVSRFSRATYNRFYNRSDFKFYSRSIHPFTALMWIDDQTSRQTNSFTLRMTGNAGADGRGSFRTIARYRLSFMDFNISYSGFQIFGTGDPTICALFFYLSSATKWRSIPATQYSMFHRYKGSDSMDTRVTLSGKPRRVLFGYMLLSRYTSGINSKALSGLELTEVVKGVAASLRAVNVSNVNDCVLGNHTCHAFATCVSNLYGHTCTCRSGYTGNGTYCSDINECQGSFVSCRSNSECLNTNGSYRCVCNSGFSGNYYCSDINECKNGNNTCSSNAVCINTFGSYRCECPNGFIRNGTECEDTDECIVGNHTCRSDAHCVNIPGSYTCVCYDGFSQGAINCSDISTPIFYVPPHSEIPIDIIGIVVGGFFVFIGILAFIAFWFRRTKRRKQRKNVNFDLISDSSSQISKL